MGFSSNFGQVAMAIYETYNIDLTVSRLYNEKLRIGSLATQLARSAYEQAYPSGGSGTGDTSGMIPNVGGMPTGGGSIPDMSGAMGGYPALDSSGGVALPPNSTGRGAGDASGTMQFPYTTSSSPAVTNPSLGRGAPGDLGTDTGLADLAGLLGLDPNSGTNIMPGGSTSSPTGMDAAQQALIDRQRADLARQEAAIDVLLEHYKSKRQAYQGIKDEAQKNLKDHVEKTFKNAYQ